MMITFIRSIVPSMQLPPLALLFFLCVSLCSCKDPEQLTNSTFYSTISQHTATLVEFYTDWCGVCKKFDPVYNETHAQLLERSIPIFKVNCQHEQGLCQDLDIQGYPTVKAYVHGVYRNDVDERTKEELVRLMIRLNQPSYQEFSTADQVNAFVKDKDLAFIAYFPSKTDPNIEQFKNATRHFQEIADYAILYDASDPTPCIYIYRAGALDSSAVFKGPFTAQSIRLFLFVERLPLVGALDENTYGRYWQAGLPIVHLFYMTNEERNDLTELAQSVARKFRYNVTFGVIDGFAHASHAQSIGLKEEKFPACSIFHPEKLHKFPMNQSDQLTQDAIELHIAGLLNNSIQPHFMSAEAPRPNNDPVVIVVRNEFDSLVLDPKKDVLVMFYASWCQACKRFSHHYDMLGMSFAARKNDTLIGKMNLDVNDPPEIDLVIQAIPTLVLFPASEDGQTKNPAFFKYEGDFSLDSIFDFLKHHSTHKAEPQSYHEQDFEEELDDEHVDL